MAAHQLGHHAARADSRPCAPGHGLEFRRDRSHDGDQLGRGVLARIGGIQAVDVGKQDKDVGAHHRRDPGGEAIVVTESDLVGRDRVVLVDHRASAPTRSSASTVLRAFR